MLSLQSSRTSQRRQSGSKSEGVVNPVAEIFDSSRKNSDFPEKSRIFQAKILTTFYLVVNSQNCLFP